MKKGLQLLSVITLLLFSTSISVAQCDEFVEIGISEHLLCPGEETSLNVYTDEIDKVAWDFGDGSSSDDQYPNKSYDTEGDYVITCTITNNCGKDTVLTDSVVVSNSQPFKFPSATINVDNPVCVDEQFIMSVENAYGDREIRWNLSAGITDYREDHGLEFSFSAVDQYAIEAKVTDACGNDSIIHGIVVVANKTSFDGSVRIDKNDSLCKGEKTGFYVNSNAKHYEWSFSDGQNSKEASPYVAFSTTGNITFSVKLTDYCGNDTTLNDSIYIKSGGGVFNGWVSLSVPDSICLGDEHEFQAAVNGAGSATLTFGNGDTVTTTDEYYNYTYAQAGKYEVTLIAKDQCGNSSELHKDSVVVGTLGERENIHFEDFLPDSVCPGDQVFLFNDDLEKHASADLWNLGDGTVSNEKIISHEYASAGTYKVTLSIVGVCGDKMEIIDSIYVGTDVKISERMDFFDDGGLEVVDNELCLGDFVSVFTFYPGEEVVHFGDGNQGSYEVDSLAVFGEGLKLPIGLAHHSYSAKGNYIAYSIIENGCGIKDTVHSELIQVKGNVAVDASLDLGIESEDNDTIVHCTNRDVVFLADGGSSYSFDFGDGTTKVVTGGQAIFMEHQYAALGTYEVKVTISNNCGDSDTDNLMVYVTTECTKVDTGTGGVNGIVEISLATSVYPNPTNDVVNVDVSSFGGSAVLVKVFNVHGQLLSTTTGTGDIQQISLREFGTGLYFVSVKGEAGSGVSVVQVN
ncbi:MAG: PKD repeat protein [Glaciecola sp.]|jgi:PKD repeat protein